MEQCMGCGLFALVFRLLIFFSKDQYRCSLNYRFSLVFQDHSDKKVKHLHIYQCKSLICMTNPSLRLPDSGNLKLHLISKRKFTFVNRVCLVWYNHEYNLPEETKVKVKLAGAFKLERLVRYQTVISKYNFEFLD